MVRGDDGVVCSVEEGGATVVRNRNGNAGDGYSQDTLQAGRVASSTQNCHTIRYEMLRNRICQEPKQHHKAHKCKQDTGYTHADKSRDTNVFPLAIPK